MSELNINRKIFLEQEELRRFQLFLKNSTANKVTLGNTTGWGILRTDFSGNETDFLVEAGTNSGTIQIANDSFGVDSDENLISQLAIDNIEVANDSVWRWVRISHTFRRYEVGTVSIDVDGNLSGSGTLFTDVLRGQSTDVPVNIKFLKSDLTAANNSGYYQVVSISDDGNAILTSNVAFQAESDLYYVVIGSTPIDENITTEQADGVYKYDSCLLELIDEEILDTPPTTGFVEDKTFYVARVRNTGTELTIQDKREDYWGFNIVGISDKLDKNQNLNDLTNKTTARNNLDVYPKNSVYTKTESDNKYMIGSNNLSDVNDPATARTILGAQSQTEADARYLQSSNNLSDLDSVATARTNLDVYSKSETYAQAEIETEIESRISSTVGVVVYSAYCFETSDSTVNPSSNIYERKNDSFISQFGKNIEDRYIFTMTAAINESNFYENYMIYITPCNNQAEIGFRYYWVDTTHFWVDFEPDVPMEFQIEIKSWI